MRDSKENHRLRALLWIVRLLEKHGALTLKEINEYWCADESLSDGVPTGIDELVAYPRAKTEVQ